MQRVPWDLLERTRPTHEEAKRPRGDTIRGRKLACCGLRDGRKRLSANIGKLEPSSAIYVQYLRNLAFRTYAHAYNGVRRIHWWSIMLFKWSCWTRKVDWRTILPSVPNRLTYLAYHLFIGTLQCVTEIYTSSEMMIYDARYRPIPRYPISGTRP